MRCASTASEVESKRRSQRGIADAAAGIDARAQYEAQMIGRRRRGEACRIGESSEADVLAGPHDGETLLHVGAVEACQRNDVSHGCECHEVEKRQQIGFACRAIISSPPQLARDRDDDEEDDTCRAKCALPRYVVLTVRIDDGFDFGEPLVCLMVIDDDNVGAETARQRQRLVARRAAVDGDDQPGALVDQGFYRPGVRPIAFEQAIGNVDPRRRLVVLQKPLEQRRRTGAVDIIVAEDRDLLPRLDRVGETRGCLVHVAE